MWCYLLGLALPTTRYREAHVSADMWSAASRVEEAKNCWHTACAKLEIRKETERQRENSRQGPEKFLLVNRKSLLQICNLLLCIFELLEARVNVALLFKEFCPLLCNEPNVVVDEVQEVARCNVVVATCQPLQVRIQFLARTRQLSLTILCGRHPPHLFPYCFPFMFILSYMSRCSCLCTVHVQCPSPLIMVVMVGANDCESMSCRASACTFIKQTNRRCPACCILSWIWPGRRFKHGRKCLFTICFSHDSSTTPRNAKLSFQSKGAFGQG